MARRTATTSSTRPPAAATQPPEVPSADGSAGHRTAFSYLRVSSVKQAADDRSGLDRQGDAFLPFCDRHGLVPSLDPLIDRGISAYRGKHRQKGALAAFLAAARDGTIPSGSVLVVEDLDRFSREAPSHAEATLLQVFDLGLSLGLVRDDVVVDRDLYDRDIGVRLQLLVRRDAAHDYSRKLSSRVAAAHERIRARERQGERVNVHWRPQWLDYDEAADTYTLNDRWPTYRRIVDLCLDGHGQVRTAATLNAEGHRNAHGGLWSGAAVAQVLADRRLIGERSYKIPGTDQRERLAGYFPAAISTAEFTRVQEQIAQRRSNRGRAGRGERRHNLFQTIAFCHCGQRLELHTARKPSGRTHSYLVCKSKIRGRGEGRCMARNFPYDEEWLLRSFMAERWSRFFHRPADSKQRRELDRKVREAEGLLGQQRQHQQQAETNLSQLLLTGTLDADTAALLGKAAKDARQQADATEAALMGVREQLRQALHRPDGAAMQKLIRDRVEAFLAADRHDTAERIRFNDWLCTLNVRVCLLWDGSSAQMTVEPLVKATYDDAGGVTVAGAELHVKVR